MRSKLLVQCAFWSLLVSLLLTACTPRFETVHVTGLPANVSHPDTRGVDVDVVLESARHEVQKVLPDAYLTFLLFSGTCEGLPELHGTLKMGFLQVQSGIMRRRVLSGVASVNTIEETMTLRFADYSDRYPSTTPWALQDALPVKKVAAIAREYIVALGLSDCDVALTYLEDSWLVVCTTSGSGVLGPRECEFKINPSTGKIIIAQQ